MNQWRRVCSVVLSVAMALTLMLGCMTTQVDAAKKAKLKTKSITVQVKKTKKITIANKNKKYKYSFTSKNKKVATVTTSGKVKGIKAGKTKITVKETNKKKKKRTLGTVSVTVKKATPVKTPTPTTNNQVSTPPTVTNAPVVTDSPKSGTPSLKLYVDEVKDGNEIGTIGDVGYDPTPTPVVTEAPATPEPTPCEIYNLTFEGGEAAPVAGRGDATVAVQDDGANSTSKSVFVSGRTQVWNGAFIDVTDTMATGGSYDIVYYVKHSDASAQKIDVCLEYTDEDGAKQYPTIKSTEIPTGAWTKVEANIASVPEHTGTINLYWQTNYSSASLIDFSLDEIVVTGVPKAEEETPAADLTYGLSKVNVGNPIMTSRLTADPWAMEYNGRIYVYGTNDSQQYEKTPTVDNNYAKINTLNVYSSADMVNWTDHGQIQVAGKDGAASKWAGNSWAPAAAHKTINGKEKFFLYFANSANNIGVLTSDSPVGPWVDPIGKPIIDRDTPGCSTSEIAWLFDPAVLVDDDGSAYLYFGGIGDTANKDADYIKNPKCAAVVKLNDDMTSIACDPVMIDAPYMFEDSGINKIGNKYYYSYCTNWTGSVNGVALDRADCPAATIGVMESDNPMTGFKYVGSVMKNPGTYFGATGNNHHCIAAFKGVYYSFYHTKKDTIKLGTPEDYRTTYVNKLNLGTNGNFTNTDNSVADTKMTVAGVSSIGTVNPYDTVEAETFSTADGVGTVPTAQASSNMLWTAGNCVLTNGKIAGSVGVSDVDFGTDGATKVTMSLGNLGTDNNTAYTATLDKKVTGKHTLYLVFQRSGITVDNWKFVK